MVKCENCHKDIHWVERYELMMYGFPKIIQGWYHSDYFEKPCIKFTDKRNDFMGYIKPPAELIKDRPVIIAEAF